MSLVEYDGIVHFIWWTNAQAQVGDGQIVIPRCGKLIFPSNLKTRITHVRNFSHCFIVYPDLGIEPEKTSKQAERTEVPARVARLSEMWGLGISAGRTPICSICCICGQGSKLMTCPLCLLTFHTGCSELLSLCQHRLAPTDLENWSKPLIVLKELQHWHDASIGRISLCNACMSHVELG